MLVLSRRPEEAIVIGDDIVVRVNLVQGNQVRLGIAAPADVRIRRLELLEPAEMARLAKIMAGKGEE